MRKLTVIIASCLFAAALFAGQTGSLTLNGFGDSITQGAGASSGASTWFTLVTLSLGLIPNNQAVGGAAVYDMAPLVLATTVNSNTRSTVDIGQNDGTHTLNYQSDWLAALEANYLWLLTPNKFFANSGTCSSSGNWSADDLWPAIGEKTATAGSSMTCSIFGTSAYIIFGAELNSTVTASVSVDGGAPITVNPATRWVAHNGATISPYALRIAGLAYTTHSIVITAGNISDTPLRVLWAAGNSGQLTSTGPYVYSMTLYQTGLPNIYQAATNADILRGTQELSADGLGITLVDIDAACYGTNLAPLCNQADGTHPNDTGQEIIAKAVLSKINSASAAGGLTAPEQPTVLQTSSDLVSNNALIVQSQSGTSSACLTAGANGVLVPGDWNQVSGICSPGGRISLGTTDSAASLTVRGSVSIEGLADPLPVAVGPYYGTGTTTYSYVVVAVAADGSHTAASGAGTITDGAASFGYPTGAVVTRYLVPNAVSYDIYRVVGGNSQGKIGSTSAADFYDWGAPGDGTSPPITNTTGQLTANSIVVARPIQGTLYTPPRASSPCTPGVFADDDHYHYVCTSSGRWKRVELHPF